MFLKPARSTLIPCFVSVFLLLFHPPVSADEDFRVLKIAPQDQIVLLQLGDRTCAIGIGDQLTGYGSLFSVSAERLVFKGPETIRDETVIIIVKGDAHTVHRISRQTKQKTIQIPLQHDQ